MNDRLGLSARPVTRPTLPMPTRRRWQPLRLGLVELYHYDSEEFWFRDGHLLLRGNNGTGKSKVLSLTLPFLFDAQLKSSRIEPDGDAGKRMAWNLLMNGHDRRQGYAWIEFGRVDEDGTQHFLSLGAGMSASTARPQVDSWFFVLEEGPWRINQDLWLTSPQRVVLTRERLREAVLGRGEVFDTAGAYRRRVDERLFRLGSKRYDALMDTLIQLRQPQLSLKPDEAALSDALTEALPPLAPDLLGDVAEALGRLEEDRRQLEEYQALTKVVGRFEERYRVYAGTQTRRQARLLRQAQTEFDTASRDLREAQSRLGQAREREAHAQAELEDHEVALARARVGLDTLRSDPTMQDANRLEAAEREGSARQRSMRSAAAAVEQADRRLKLGTEEARSAGQRAEWAAGALDGLRRQGASHAEAVGIAALHAANPLAALGAADLAELTQPAFDRACAELGALAASRRGEIAVLRRRHDEVARAQADHLRRQDTRDERRSDADEAALGRAQADAEVERQGRDLAREWDDHLDALGQLRIDPDDRLAALTALADWTGTLQGDNPARRLLQASHERTSHQLAERGSALDGRRQDLEREQGLLDDERRRLLAGHDIAPPPPATRDGAVRQGRDGAPFWQVVDFHDAVTARQRAGLEAALEAAGLLDAWISPDGRLQAGAGGAPLHDTQLLERRPAPLSLADWLAVTLPAGCSVPAGIVARMLSGCACADEDPVDGEAWVAVDGRYRLGAVSGAWDKPAAAHIGYAARAAARAGRLAEIAERLAQLSGATAELRAAEEQLVLDRAQADDEWRRAPADDRLRGAHLAAVADARAARVANDRLAEADARYREAERALTALRDRLAADAADLRLPSFLAALLDVETELDHYRDMRVRLEQAARELRLALPEWKRRQTSEDQLRGDLEQRDSELAASRIEAEEAAVRFQVLRDSVGAKVGDLQRRIGEARSAVEAGDATVRRGGETVRKAGEARAVADQQAGTAGEVLRQRVEARGQAVSGLQRFTATGLLSAALPQVEPPDVGVAWTIDPALTLARAAEQGLSHLRDDDDTWARVQGQIAGELNELQRALGALGQQAQADPSDWGFSVAIIYQNRRERPDRLAVRLAEEIAQRVELLGANERTVLENHLQAEIAAEIQRLLNAADRQVAIINQELHKRPTSTGVRYQLLWQPVAEEDGAPAGLDVMRKRLFNISAELWSADDRRVIGTMLQRRIAAQREQADRHGGKDAGGSLLDQLARALDYRHWHRFRVERWQDGHWRKLSGPASSGERALGLTVPLFAAVASFYGQGGNALAPRLMLLDEAFAGIDDAARAHCMGLIREFDLDFVITSEREWACYAELPGVAICQLQRREGIDAVFVSRWTWDGRERAGQADPDRRYPPK